MLLSKKHNTKPSGKSVAPLHSALSGSEIQFALSASSPVAVRGLAHSSRCVLSRSPFPSSARGRSTFTTYYILFLISVCLGFCLFNIVTHLSLVSDVFSASRKAGDPRMRPVVMRSTTRRVNNASRSHRGVFARRCRNASSSSEFLKIACQINRHLNIV